MTVPEIDRLAHEILDILDVNLPKGKTPYCARSVAYRALVAVDRELGEVYAAGKPLFCRLAKSLQASDLGLEEGSPVWDYATRKLQASPALALLCLEAALERAEMQERATATADLATNEVPLLPLAGGADDDVRGHAAENTA